MDAKTDHKLLDDVSLARRQLLRAAASVAPLIATLPSGAALAQASARNCVLLEQEAAERGEEPPAIAASTDSYIRVPGSRTLYEFPYDNINDEEKAAQRDVYQFTVPGTQRDVSVDAEGNWIDLDKSQAIKIGNTEPQYFLVLYKSVGFEGKVTELCDLENRVHFWPEGAPQASSPDFCIAPLAKVSRNQPDNIAQVTSCWCSANPNAPECDSIT